MVKEYNVPLIAGDLPTGPSTLRIFEEGEMPVDIGSLDKDSFSYLGDWKFFLDNGGYGLAYRSGTKEVVHDDGGDPATLVLHFVTPITRRGREMNESKVEELTETLKTVVTQFTVLAHQMYGENVMSYATRPPEWMTKELSDLLR